MGIFVFNKKEKKEAEPKPQAEQKMLKSKEGEKPFLCLRGFFTAMSVIFGLHLIITLVIGMYGDSYRVDGYSLPGWISAVQSLINILLILLVVIVSVVCLRKGLKGQKYPSRVAMSFMIAYLFATASQAILSVRNAFLLYYGWDYDIESVGYIGGSLYLFVTVAALVMAMFMFWTVAEHPYYLAMTFITTVVGVILCLFFPKIALTDETLLYASWLDMFFDTCSSYIHYIVLTAASISVAVHLYRSEKRLERVK